MELWITFTFEASHTLPQPIGKPVMHGHSYWVRVFVDSSEKDPVPLPMLEGYAGLVRSALDHKHLNDIMESPTMESIAMFVAKNIQTTIPVVRVDVERQSIGAGITFYPGAHGASYWRARAEHYQAEAKHMAKAVDFAWQHVDIANQRLKAAGLPRVNSPGDKP